MSENDKDLENFIKSIEKVSLEEEEHKYLFRICLLGDAGVGKTSLLSRFCDNTFKQNYNNTIGVDFRLITLKYKDIISKIHIWDTAGQERFRSLTSNYLNNSHGFIFVYDITDKDSFTNVSKWIKLAFEKNGKSITNFLVGNKSDNESQRKVSKEEGENFCLSNKVPFLEVSALKFINVKEAFLSATKGLLQINFPEKYKNSGNNGGKKKCYCF